MRGTRVVRSSILAGAAAAALLAPAAAHAGSVTATSLEICPNNEHGCGYYLKTVFYSDPTGWDGTGAAETNTVTIRLVSPGVVSVRDTTATVTLNPSGSTDPCELKSEHEAVCTLKKPGELEADVHLGDLDDSLRTLYWGTRWTFAYGGPGDDALTTGAGRDSLNGDDGNDVLDGGDGDDSIQGGDGIDTVNYSSRTEAVRVSLGDGDESDGAADERDDVDGDVERVLGGSGNDTLIGNAGPDLLGGGPGDDTMDGGTGRDLMSGGAGNDTISYAGRSSSTSVAVHLNGKADDGADPNHDGVSAVGEEHDQDYLVENVVGGAGNDRLTGNNYVNSLFGGPGMDRLDGGFGADTLDGGGGSDTAYYATRTQGQPVAVTLDGVRNDGSDPNADGVSDAGEEHDQDVAVENATGGAGPDLLRSALATANILTGNAGDDRIYALDGATAVDHINCGSGTDRFQADPDDVPSACEDVILPER